MDGYYRRYQTEMEMLKMAQTQQKSTGKGVGEVLGDVLNQAKEGIMSFGETIASKSKEVMDNTRLNTQKAQIKGENDMYYQKLGQLVREKREYTDEMDSIANKIAENEKRLEDVEAQLNEMNGTASSDSGNKDQKSGSSNSSAKTGSSSSSSASGGSKSKSSSAGSSKSAGSSGSTAKSQSSQKTTKSSASGNQKTVKKETTKSGSGSNSHKETKKTVSKKS